MDQSIRIPAAAKSVRIPALASIAAKLESRLESISPSADSRDVVLVQVAFHELSHAVLDALEALDRIGGRASLEDLADASATLRMNALVAELAGSLPPVRGGGFDDHEDIDPAFLADPHGWPAGYDADLDGYTWEPTPDHILAAEYDAHTDAHDWDAYAALDVTGISEADHVVATGCC